MLESQADTQKPVSALQDPQRRGRIIIGIVSLIVAAGYLWRALLMPQGDADQPGPGLWPVAVGIAWLVISIIVIAEAAASVQVGGDVDVPKGEQRRHVVWFYALTVVFVVLIPIVGIYLAAILYVVALMRLTSSLSHLKVLIYGTLIGFAIPWAFITLLQIRLPLGFFGQLL